MKPLSKEAENLVISAVQNLNGLVTDGQTPTHAAVKVAKDMGLGPDMLRLVCQGYNTGAAMFQRESSADILHKMAEFPLASADEALKILYPPKDQLKKAYDKSVTSVSEEYSAPPKLSKFASVAGGMEKSASVSLREQFGLEKAPPLPTEPREFQLATAQVDRIKKANEAARLKVSEARDVMLHHLGNFAEYFRRQPHDRQWAFGEVKYAAEHKFGKSGSEAMNYVAASNGYTVQTAYMPKKAINWSDTPFNHLSNSIKAAKEYRALARSYEQTTRASQEKIASLLAPFKPSPKETRTLPASVIKKSASDAESGAAKSASVVPFLMGSAAGSGVFNSLMPPSTDSLVQDKYDELADPEHEEKLRGIRAQSMLQDFMSNDPVLSGYDPDVVMRAYNDFASLSPRVALQPTVVRPVLRRWVTQGAIEPFEAKDLTDMEKTMVQTQKPDKTPFAEKSSNVLKRHAVLAK